MGGNDAHAEVGAVLVRGVGGVDAAAVGGHDDGGDEEGEGGGEEEEGARPGFGVFGPGAAGGEGAGGAGDGDEVVAGREVFVEGKGHSSDHIEGEEEGGEAEEEFKQADAVFENLERGGGKG